MLFTKMNVHREPAATAPRRAIDGGLSLIGDFEEHLPSPLMEEGPGMGVLRWRRLAADQVTAAILDRARS